ncbi:hypothetical protein EV191_11164 [Tamaricihabitans halophyticus]|uniref:LPXTG-motif cell wall-anchored protein n=2 Tax=Tamaricihabitans halophyticus TaxID=1262583 RepID=A0A4R2QGN2_9PSEU|nr:hypothetical protein EV191_11164 [Tamaricihabitans halophyticus]
MLVRSIGVGAATAVLSCVFAAPATAAPAEPTLAAAEVTVTMRDTGADVVRSEFRLTRPTTEATPIELLVPHQRDARIVSVTTPDDEHDLAARSANRITTELASGTQEYVVEHELDRTAQARAVPLVIPDIPTDRAARVGISVALPAGQRLVGDSMPSFRQADSGGDQVTVEHRGNSLPSTVVADYGSTDRLSLGTVVSIGSGLFLAIVVVFWAVGIRRKERAEQ